MFIRDIIDEALASSRISSTMRDALLDFRSRERNAHHGKHFRMNDIAEMARQRKELESQLISTNPEFA